MGLSKDTISSGPLVTSFDSRVQRGTSLDVRTYELPKGVGASNFRSLACSSMNPQHLKLLSDWSDLYRHLVTLAFTQHGPAQRGFAADDLNELSAAD
jgi:lysozyme family protein